MIAIYLLLAAAEPSTEALDLGRELAEAGTLAAVLPLIQQKEADELVQSSEGLTAADKERLRAVSKAVFEAGRDRLMDATAKAYAERLSVEDLRALAAFYRTDSAKRFRDATPEAIAATMQAVGPLDFKRDVRAAFCKETGKLCETD